MHVPRGRGEIIETDVGELRVIDEIHFRTQDPFSLSTSLRAATTASSAASVAGSNSSASLAADSTSPTLLSNATLRDRLKYQILLPTN